MLRGNARDLARLSGALGPFAFWEEEEAMAGVTVSLVAANPPNTTTLVTDISADGQFVAYLVTPSNATGTGTQQLVVANLQTGAFTSVASFAYIEGGSQIWGGELSASGRYIVYSDSQDLLAGGTGNVFVEDLQTGITTQVTNADPAVSKEVNYTAGISGDGRYVLYMDEPLTFGATWSIDVKDLQTGAVQTVANWSSLDQTASDWVPLDISADGRYVLFETDAPLFAGDSGQNLFVKDLQTGTLTQIGTDAGGLTGFGSPPAFMSADGRFIAYEESTGGADFSVFVRDQQTGTDTLVGQGAGALAIDIQLKGISGDGERVALFLAAGNPLATAGGGLYVKDLITGTVTLISSRSNPDFAYPSFDGSAVAFDGVGGGVSLNGHINPPGVYVADLTPPTLTIDPITGDDSINAAEATGPIVISGTSNAIGQIVTVIGDVAGKFAQPVHFTVVQANGTWSTTYSVAGLPDGPHTYTAEVRDAVGTLATDSRTAILDTTPPALAILPVDGNDTINAAEAPAVQVTGTSDAIGQTVGITFDGNSVGTALVQIDGTWSTTIDAVPFPDGEHVFAAKVADSAGNVSDAARDVLIKTAPPKLAILSVDGDDVVSQSESTRPALIVGTSDAIGGLVQVFRDGTQIGSTVVLPDGTWSASAFIGPVTAGPHHVSATVSDIAGNSASAAVPVLVDAPVQIVSVDTLGNQPVGVEHFEPSMSADGRYTIFRDVNDLVAASAQIFIKDMETGALTLVSSASNGTPGDKDSYNHVLSADGQHAAFASAADNLVSGDTNQSIDIFVKDLSTGNITLVDSSSTGVEGNQGADSGAPSISSDGHYVAFESRSTNLDPTVTTPTGEVYEKDTQSGALTLVSTGLSGPANGLSDNSTMSADGRIVAFASTATNLVAGANGGIFVKNLDTGVISLGSADGNGIPATEASTPGLSPDGHFLAFAGMFQGDTHQQIYLKNLDTGALTLVSAAADGTEGNSLSGGAPSVSDDGRYVAFFSYSQNLVPGDTNVGGEYFVKDMQTGAIVVASAGNGGISNTSEITVPPSISADGHYVAFEDFATDLVANSPGNGENIFLRDLQPAVITIAPIGTNDLLGVADLNPTQMVTGTSDQIGATVKVWLDGLSVTSAIVQADGTWSTSIDTVGLADGTHQMWASVKDALGFQSSKGQLLHVETQGPTVTLSSDHTHIGQGATATIGFLFSEDVTGFNLGDITATGGTLGPLVATNGHSYAAVFTPTAGKHLATFQVAANSVADAAGNTNSAAGMVLGVAVDGYIAGATVFADANGNGIFDPGEVGTTTDNFGSFVLSGGSGPLVMVGGTDIATGLPFHGLLSAPAGSTVITPLTTLLTLLQAQGVANAQLATALVLSSGIDLENFDPVAAAINGSTDGEAVFAAGAAILDTVTDVATMMAGGGTVDFLTAFNDTFAVLAGSVAASTSALNLADPNLITALIGGVLQKEGQSADANTIAGVVQIVAGLNAAIQTATQSAPTGADALAAISAVEIVAQGAAADALENVIPDPTSLNPGLAAFSGTSLTAAIADAQDHTGDVVGDMQFAPIAHDDSYTISTGLLIVGAKGVLANDTDLNGDPLTAVLVSGPAHGDLSLNPDGSFVYAPDANFTGSDSFTYEANDGALNSNVATATIAVTASALPPQLLPVVKTAAVAPGTGIEGIGANITIALDMSEAVTVTGEPTIALNDGGTATYASGSGSSTLLFNYNVASTDSNEARLAIDAVSTNGAAVTDAAGNDADFSGAETTFTGLQIETTSTATLTVAAAADLRWATLFDELANSPIASVGTSTQFTCVDTGSFNGHVAAIKFVVTETGLTFSGSFPSIQLTGGTITGIQVVGSSNNALATFTGLLISATAFQSALSAYMADPGSPDPTALNAILLGSRYNTTAGPGIEKLQGGDIEDLFHAGSGNDSIDGGGGSNTVDYSGLSTPGLVAIIAGGGGAVNKGGSNGVDTLTHIQTLAGSSASDVFYVDGAETVDGDGGFDYLIELSAGVSLTYGINFTGISEFVSNIGNNSIDFSADPSFAYLYGSTGNDTLTLGSGGGYLFGEGGSNVLNGGANATNLLVGGAGGSDIINGGGGTASNFYFVDGNDQVNGAGAFNAVIELVTDVTVQLGSAQFQHVQEFVADGGNNTVSVAGGDNDFVYLYGGTGNDTLSTASGGGYLIGEGGTNTLTGGSGLNVFVADAAAGVDTMKGGSGSNVYFIDSHSTVQGAGTFNTAIELEQGVALTLGSAQLGTDVQEVVLNGGNNTVNFSGATGSSYLYGAAGNDTLLGGTGNDYLWGGAGSNTFVFQPGWGKDTIMDWTAGTNNMIDLTGLAGAGVHGMADIAQSIVNGSDVIGSSHTGTNSITLYGLGNTLTGSSFKFA